jgi:hypothetical protein
MDGESQQTCQGQGDHEARLTTHPGQTEFMQLAPDAEPLSISLSRYAFQQPTQNLQCVKRTTVNGHHPQLRSAGTCARSEWQTSANS